MSLKLFFLQSSYIDFQLAIYDLHVQKLKEIIKESCYDVIMTSFHNLQELVNI